MGYILVIQKLNGEEYQYQYTDSIAVTYESRQEAESARGDILKLPGVQGARTVRIQRSPSPPR